MKLFIKGKGIKDWKDVGFEIDDGADINAANDWLIRYAGRKAKEGYDIKIEHITDEISQGGSKK